MSVYLAVSMRKAKQQHDPLSLQFAVCNSSYLIHFSFIKNERDNNEFFFPAKTLCSRP